jgi:hypothetical protein
MNAPQAPTDNTYVADPPRRWFVRGTAVGLLLLASINALSYFFRSADWGGLVGQPTSSKESVGFPFTVWEAGNTYGGMFADYPNMGWNILVAVAIGSIIGWFAARHTEFLNRLIEEMMQGEASRHQHQPIQFSLRGLLIATTIAAVASTLARSFAARPETLIAIYALGPTTLVAIAMLPHRLSWQKRVMVIIPATLTLIAIAIAVGNAMSMEFDKVLMGIFLCWTPQSALAAIGLTSTILITQARQTSGPARLSN